MTQLMTLILLFATSSFALADEKSAHAMHEADVFVDGSAIDIDSDQLERFTADLPGGQVAVVSVMGMVCDFCARGIEKTFGKDSAVTKIDVDLSSGKVLLAYAPETEINRAGIEQNILNNGLNTTAIQLVGK